MKEQGDLVRGLLRKADSDLLAADATLKAGVCDAAAFHAQQAVEKLLKAFLASEGVEFPFTHNLSKLVELCADADSGFSALLPVVEPLTPYAVELRYDSDFWPSGEACGEAIAAANTVRAFVLERLGLSGPPA